MKFIHIIIAITALLCVTCANAKQDVRASLNTNDCSFGDTVTLLLVTPTNFTPPVLQTIPSFIKYFTTLQQTADIKHSDKTITYSWTIKPITTGILEIPPLPIEASPGLIEEKENNTKQILYTKPIPIQVIGKQFNKYRIPPINTNSDVYLLKKEDILFRQPITTLEQQHLWKKANAGILTAITTADYMNAATDYLKLIKAQARTGEIYYNLGTALLHAKQPTAAWKALVRAERYIGRKPEIQHNMDIIINIMPNENLANWTRIIFKWHYSLAISTRLYLAVACLAVLLLFIFIICITPENKSQHQHRLMLLTLIIFIGFTTSIAISIIKESSDRDIEKYAPVNTSNKYIPSPKIGKHTAENTTQNRQTKQFTGKTTKCDKSLAITVSSNIDEPYVNQNFILTLTVKSNKPLGHEIEINELPPSSILYRNPFKELPIRYQQVAGKTAEIHQYRCQARAKQAGRIKIAPILTVIQISEGSNVIVNIQAEPLSLTVKPLPATNSAEEFSGAVGQFTIKSKSFPARPTYSDLIKITTTINGSGYVPENYSPRIHHAPGFIIYDPIKINGSKENRVYEQFLAPLSRNATNIPVISFTYFDPQNNIYTSHTNNF